MLSILAQAISSNLKKTKPWFNQNIFNPLEKSGSKVIHVDAESFPGVDIFKI